MILTSDLSSERHSRCFCLNTILRYTVSQKNAPTLANFSFDKHGLLYTVGQKKNVQLDISFITLINADRFSQFFTVGLASKFATRLVSYFPPHLQRVATLRYPVKSIISKIAKFWRI